MSSTLKLLEIGSYGELVAKLKNYERNVLQLTQHLRTFVQVNQDPKLSPNFVSREEDDMRILIQLLDIHFNHCVIVLLILKVIKILSRKSVNRKNLSLSLIDSLLRVICTYRSDSQICVEFSNVILNICYEKENVPIIVTKGCVLHLIRLLSGDHLSDYKLLTAVVGAIQSICFQKEGKESIRQNGATKSIIQLLSCRDTTVRSRAVGSIHNLSSDLSLVDELRDCGVIPDLISLLKDPNISIAASAAGCIQNLSREDRSRVQIKECGGVMPLAEMLFVDHLPAQTCAAGALLNILGPGLGQEVSSNPERKALRNLMSTCIFLGQMSDIFQFD